MYYFQNIPIYNHVKEYEWMFNNTTTHYQLLSRNCKQVSIKSLNAGEVPFKEAKWSRWLTNPIPNTTYDKIYQKYGHIHEYYLKYGEISPSISFMTNYKDMWAGAYFTR